MAVHAYNPSLGKAETGDLEFESSLGYNSVILLKN